MKKQLLALSSLLVATLFSTPVAANSENDAETIGLVARPYINTGMTRDTVHFMLGAPSARLAADVWVYFDFKPVNGVAKGTQNSAAANHKDALVVVFKDDRISLIRACDSAPIQLFLAQQEKSRRTVASTAAK